ncbi:glycosyltransferase family 4 protein [Phenylobacterium aquaticum]|uniref:glycosyltransferase family 4 protein n=1 Tax=Phenylobacterium aquaticum TaxID=1763816 RepID=UPI001F5C8882|nr:glycosyltransferase family 4 protein [Phenylobacterium aquaticum]MCI3134058.1 glycosyltransferase family 4 protein [Phenylobacterium aquaticum]
MAHGLTIHNPGGQVGLGANPFGRDVANLQLYQALGRHGGFDRIDFMTLNQVPPEALAEGLYPGETPVTPVGVASMLDHGAPARAGTLLRGGADLAELAWHRRRAVGDRAYSLVGLVHTLAPPAIRALIAGNLVAPTQPWDALICTSPAVRDAVEQMFEAWGDHMAERFGATLRPAPRLPLIPLGVDGPAMAAAADRPEVRSSRRAELGVGAEDILVLWVGRLSFFEKAFPQPMFRALEEAAQRSGKRLTFAMAGWFPNGEADRRRYVQAAEAYAPSVALRLLDGNDRGLLGELWAASDIFLSLVDNIQETFGITPIEAMAAGLPVVASDWDGYRYTVRDGVEGFLIPTLGGPPGVLGGQIAARHLALIESYQVYVGSVAQHTAVHVGRAAEALARLASDPDLRRRMGAAGRARVAAFCDWPVVARQIKSLTEELAEVRAAAPGPAPRPALDPVRGDPFADFAGFATEILGLDTALVLRPGVGPADLERAETVELDRAFGVWRGQAAEHARLLEILADGAPRKVRDLLLAFPAERRRQIHMSLAWMAKLGLVDWL